MNFNNCTFPGKISGYQFESKLNDGEVLVIETNNGIRGIGIGATASCVDGKWEVRGSSFTFKAKKVYIKTFIENIIYEEEKS